MPRIPSRIPSLPFLFVPLQLQFYIHSSASLVFFVFVSLHHPGLQVGSGGGGGRGRRARAGGAEVGGDTGRAAAGSQPPQQHPHRAGGAHQPVVSDTLRSLAT